MKYIKKNQKITIKIDLSVILKSILLIISFFSFSKLSAVVALYSDIIGRWLLFFNLRSFAPPSVTFTTQHTSGGAIIFLVFSFLSYVLLPFLIPLFNITTKLFRCFRSNSGCLLLRPLYLPTYSMAGLICRKYKVNETVKKYGQHFVLKWTIIVQ